MGCVALHHTMFVIVLYSAGRQNELTIHILELL